VSCGPAAGACPGWAAAAGGALNIAVVVAIPRQLSSAQRQLYQQLRAEEAAAKSQTDRPRQPRAPRAGGRLRVGTAGRPGRRRGLVSFAAVLLAVMGGLSLLAGILAITSSRLVFGNAGYVTGGLRAWGWALAILGAAQLLAGAGVWAGSQPARWFAVAVAGLNAITQMFLIPASPAWSLAIIAADAVALWGLCAYGSREGRP
jgi:hypothetical protein